MTPQPLRSGALGTLAGRLTARDRWLLRMLNEHSVLTTTHLHRLGWAATLRQVQSRARTLRGYEVLDGFRPLRPYGHGSHPAHLILGPVGAQVLAAETGLTVADLGYRGRARALTIAHRLSLGHDVGVANLVCDLATAAGVEVVRWWSARRCGCYFGHHTRPDAYLTLITHPDRTSSPGAGSAVGGGVGGGVGGWWEMFLEYDTGSENLSQLASKVAGYHALAEHTGVVTPVGVWFIRPGREPSARRALAEAVGALPTPGRVPILTGAPHTITGPTGAAIGAAPIGAAPFGAGSSRAAAPDDRTDMEERTAAGGRGWLPLHPGRVERVDLAALATPRPYPPTGPGAGPGVGAGSDPGGPLPAPYPYPPRGSGAPRGGVS